MSELPNKPPIRWWHRHGMRVTVSRVTTATVADLPIFHEVVRSLADDEPLEVTLDLIARRVSELAGFSFCGIIQPDHEMRAVHLGGSYGFPPKYAERLTDMYKAPLGDRTMVGSPT